MKQQRDPLKGRVKRLLKEQKDMGQVGEPAVLCCTSAVQVFVRDLARKMQKQAAEGAALTPIELKKSVLASGELNFLHEKVSAIDENDAKYLKPARGGKKRALKTAAKNLPTKKSRTTKAPKAKKANTPGSSADSTELARPGRIQSEDGDTAAKAKSAPSIPKAQALEVEEDDDYDESDSDA